MIRNFIRISLLILISVVPGIAQKYKWDSLTQKFADYRTNALQEKIFAHLDRNFYVAGENVWFKLYYIDGYLHRPLDVSKVAYFEILDKDNKAVVQTKVRLQKGEGNGQVLLPVSLASGNYLVRVYTNWMKNFGPDFYSQQPITIVNTVRKTDPIQKSNTTPLDIQFFPEGGQLVDGLKSTVAFRIVDSSGKGKNSAGAILNQKGDTVASFRPLKFGMGKFTFIPSSSEVYKVVVKGVSVFSPIPFPVVEKEGYVLQMVDTLANQLKITVRSKTSRENDREVFMLAHTRQVVKVIQAKSFSSGRTSFLIDKQKLGDGISHITLFNEARQPVSERLYFKRPPEEIAIRVQSDKAEYASRKKITLDVQATSAAFSSGSFSMSVFKSDSLNQIDQLDIRSYEFLTSDLKGHVESPAFYFSNDPDVGQATDNLMLTHGWSRFKWAEVLGKTPASPFFQTEYRGHFISGTLIDTRTGSAASGIQTFLSTPGKNIRLYTSLSDARGNVHFEVRDFLDKRKLLIQPNLNQDSLYQFRISDPYSEQVSNFTLPTLSLTSAWKNQLTARSLSMQTENTYQATKRAISRKTVIDSIAFYGEADEKYLLDDYTRFPVMEEVMREYVHGVWVRKKSGRFVFKVPDEPHHSIFQNESLVLLDGVPIFNVDKIMAFSPLKIQKLEVMTRKYFLGPFAFEGIVSYTTYKGDLGGFELDSRVTVLDYQGLQSQKEFFSPRYETSGQMESRLADRRNLLFWTPDLTLSSQQKKSIEFYSSDETGTYKIVIQGMGVDGTAGSATSSFEVKGPENN